MGAVAPAMILLDSGRTVGRGQTDSVMQGTEIHQMVITILMTERMVADFKTPTAGKDQIRHMEEEIDSLRVATIVDTGHRTSRSQCFGEHHMGHT